MTYIFYTGGHATIVEYGIVKYTRSIITDVRVGERFFAYNVFNIKIHFYVQYNRFKLR